ncbi:MAG: sulfotransferase [Alphaproteobacteria bacterium]|nr:sulfotransferase [Alphaproteobacteria bacterium]
MSRAGAFHWGHYRRFVRALWAQSGPRSLGEAALRGALMALNQATWVLDRPAPPARDTLFIVGHQRSGTTWLHRMLASHPAAGAMPLHALLLPADLPQRLFDRPRPAWLDRLQDRALGGMDPLHRIRLHEPEEDEFLAWGLFRSPMNRLDRPWDRGVMPDIHDEGDLGLAHWAQAVARAQRRHEIRHVVKNPHMTHRIASLRRALPGVRVLRLVRDPAEAIPSRLSLLRAIWRRRFPGFTELSPHHVELIYSNSLRNYLSGEGQADLDILYSALLDDPLGVVQRVHARFGLEPWDAASLAALGAHQRSGRTPHRYSLAEFGLSEARLRADLAPVYARWGF